MQSAAKVEVRTLSIIASSEHCFDLSSLINAVGVTRIHLARLILPMTNVGHTISADKTGEVDTEQSFGNLVCYFVLFVNRVF